MVKFDRRQFLEISAASCLMGTMAFDTAAQPGDIVDSGKSIRIERQHYVWEWSAETDRFRILDQRGRQLTSGPLQPAVVVQNAGKGGNRRSAPGKLESHHVEGNRVLWTYSHVNGRGKLSLYWHFDDHGVWTEPVTYETPAAEDVVSLNLFAEAADNAKPSLETTNLVLPGICESEAASPITASWMNWSTRTWIGRGSPAAGGLTQQWGLPAHFFCGFRWTSDLEPAGEDGVTRAFCCGLTELPNSDLFVEQRGGRGSLIFDYRGDLWGHLRGPGKFTLSAGLFWTFAPNYYEAIRKYYQGLLATGIIQRKVNSAKKNEVLLTPQWCTWGEQVALHKEGSELNQTALEKFYEEVKLSGLAAGMFSIDDKWEGKYGNLQHSAERLPRFEQFLDGVRADGRRIGLWAAFMRSEDPAELGLTPAQMLHQVDGRPFLVGSAPAKYYILDFTRPEVEKVLTELARRFVRRYKPDLVKFDFGYEIPALDTAAPHDMRWAGERMMAKGLDVVVKAMRQENPDIVVMYYELSPLFTDYFDLHSPDDLFMAKGEYEIEANRRFFFSGLCGEFGMPTYGSSGYDWVSGPEIWFDSAPIGTLGCLGSLGGNDEAGSQPTPERIAKYNGLTHLVRPGNQFTIQPIDAVYNAPTRGAHASSWARLENGEVVLLALRQRGLEGGPGTNEFGGFASTTASVVIASRTPAGLAQTTKLGVVPYGEGVLRIRRASKAAVAADATEHSFGGHSKASRLAVADGVIEVPLRERGENREPLEWIEIEFQG